MSYLAVKNRVMALLTGEVQFTGTMGSFSAYRMKGTDKIVIRRKGGPDREQVKRHRNFEITRRQNEEWKACVAACKLLCHSLFPVKHLADYNFSAALTGLCKSVQKDDMVNELGQRSVLLSQHYYKIEGFSLGRAYTLESFIKHPLQHGIDKAGATAFVSWPALVPGINLSNPGQQPLYRLVAVLGAVPDIVYNEEKKMYVPMADETVFPVVVFTDWHTAKQKMQAGSLSPSLPNAAAVLNHTLLLAVGIEFGIPLSNTEVRPVKRYGAGKVLRMG